MIRFRILGFCGIRMRKVVHFGTAKTTEIAKRARWIARARSTGTAGA